MKVLLLGGTGAMGNHLVQLLAGDGVDVTVTSRRRSDVAGRVRYLKGDAHDMAFLSGVLQEPWDAIVDFMVYDTATFRSRIDALLGSTGQYVFISSARVYAESSSPITEDSPRLLDVSTDRDYLATDEYALTKARQEDLLRQSGRDNWTIIRPYITYSETRLQLGVLEKEDWLFRALKGRTIVFSADLAPRQTTLTYGLDVSRGIKAIIGQSGAMGEAFHITADAPLTWEKVLSIYLEVLERHLGFRPKVVLQDLPHFLRVHPARYQILYDRMFDRVFDNRKIRQFLPTDTFVNPAAGLRRCLEAFLADPSFLGLNWRGEASKDRQTGESSRRDITGIKPTLKYLIFRYLRR